MITCISHNKEINTYIPKWYILFLRLEKLSQSPIVSSKVLEMDNSLWSSVEIWTDLIFWLRFGLGNFSLIGFLVDFYPWKVFQMRNNFWISVLFPILIFKT